MYHSSFRQEAAEAMRALSRAYPDDLDARTMFAESSDFALSASRIGS